MITEQKTHDYTKRYWGHDYTLQSIDKGRRGKITGWGMSIRSGDFLLLQNGEKSTRYRVDSISYYVDPEDMWEAGVIFAPRGIGE